jgi:hypothetical protein
MVYQRTSSLEHRRLPLPLKRVDFLKFDLELVRKTRQQPYKY